MQKAWSDEFFSHHGHFYEFPQPGVRWNHPLSPPDERFADERGMITKMSVTPRPLQRPHPPLWQVIDTPPSIEWAARRGIQGMFWLPPLSALNAASRSTASAPPRPASTWSRASGSRSCATCTWRRRWSRRGGSSRPP